MKKKIVLTVVILALVALLLVGCAESAVTVEPDVELLTNGNFESASPDAGWTFVQTEAGGTRKYPYSNPQHTGYDATHGQFYLTLTTESGTKANSRVFQTVEVQPHCTYVLSVDYKLTTAVTVGEGGRGAYVELEGFKLMSRSATEVTDGWQNWTMYFDSDDYDSVTVALGLGDSNYNATGGSVSFDNVSLRRVTDEVAGTVAAQSLATANTGSGTYDVAYRISGVDTVFTVLIVLLSACLMVVAYFLLRRLSVKKEVEIADNGMVKGSNIFKNTTFLLVVTLVVGFAMRLVLSLTLFGYGAYENALMTNTATMVENGLKDYYFNYTTYYAPGTMYVLYILGLIAAPLNLAAGTQGMAIFLKIPALISDLLLIAFVFLAVDKRKGPLWALVVGLSLALLPILYAASSLWGVYASVAALFLVLAFMAARNRHVIKLTVFYFLSVLFSEAVLLLLPLLLVYAVLQYIKCPELRIKLPVCATAALVVGYAITVPLAVNYYVAGHPFIVLERYCTAFNQNAYFARNVFNIYAMCGVGATTVNTAGVAMSAIFAALAMLGGIAMYLSNRNRQDVILYAAWTIIAVYTLCVRMDMWVLLLGVVLMYLYILYTDEKRLMWIWGAFATLSAINACYVMAVGGNVQGGVGAAGVTVASLDPVAILFSVLEVLTFFGLTYVVADICHGRKKLIMPLERGPIAWFRDTFHIGQKDSAN